MVVCFGCVVGSVSVGWRPGTLSLLAFLAFLGVHVSLWNKQNKQNKHNPPECPVEAPQK